MARPHASVSDTTLAGGQRQASGAALRDYAAAELAQAIAGLGARGGRLHAGVHQARKALRRTRATLSLGGDALGPGARLVDRELRRLNRGLSALRDAQALVETMDCLIGKRHAPDIAQRLRRARRAAATRRAATARAALRADPGLADSRALLATLRAALPTLPWEDLGLADVQRALAHTASRIARAQARVRASDVDDEDWHAWRRRLRRWSQQHRACKAAGCEVEPLPLFDKCMAEQLGAAQDLGVLLEHCRRDSPFAPDDRPTLRDFATRALAKQRERILSTGAG